MEEAPAAAVDENLVPLPDTNPTMDAATSPMPSTTISSIGPSVLSWPGAAAGSDRAACMAPSSVVPLVSSARIDAVAIASSRAATTAWVGWTPLRMRRF